MFANGTEYECFLERNCYNCPFYVHYDEATEDNPVCNIEEQIALSGMTEDVEFPYEWLDENGSMARYDCRKRLGLDKKEVVNRSKRRVESKVSKDVLYELLKDIVVD